MKHLSVVSIVLFLVGCGAASSETYEERDAKYQIAKKECSQSAAKKAIPSTASTFTREDEAIGMRELKDCMTARGFGAEVK